MKTKNLKVWSNSCEQFFPVDRLIVTFTGDNSQEYRKILLPEKFNLIKIRRYGMFVKSNSLKRYVKMDYIIINYSNGSVKMTEVLKSTEAMLYLTVEDDSGYGNIEDTRIINM